MVSQRHTPSVSIVAGTLRGRVLRYPPGRVLRPTMQRTREALFSTIEGELLDASFLDLYSGAGGVGIEALSRGARFVHFVESDPVIAAMLRENLERCGVEDERCRVDVIDSHEFLTPTALDGMSDLIAFADPPYDTPDAGNMLELFDRTAYSNVKLLVIEHGRPLEEAQLHHLELARSKRYGDARLSYFVPTGDRE